MERSFLASLPLVAPPGSADYLLSPGADEGTVALYFSAHWCPPCRRFTPLLSAFVREWDEAAAESDDEADRDPAVATPGNHLTCVFVSRDQNEEAFREYHETMCFPAVAFDAHEAREALLARYNIQSLPTLLVVDAGTGEARTWHRPAEDIRQSVADPLSAYPSFPRTTVLQRVQGWGQKSA